MRQVEAAPGSVHKAWIHGGARCAARFGKNGGDAVVKVFFGIGGVAEMEFPVVVEVDALALGGGGAWEHDADQEQEAECCEHRSVRFWRKVWQIWAYLERYCGKMLSVGCLLRR